MTPEEIMAALGPGRCTYCGQDQSKSSALVQPCKQAGRHITFSDNALRIEFAMSWGEYWSKIETYGTPEQSPLAWVQSKDKARKWQANTRVVRGVPRTPPGTMNG